MTDVDIIEFRIQELEYVRARLQAEMDALEERRTELKGAIAEMWQWHDTAKDSQGYGKTTFDGKSKVLKLPTAGSPTAIKDEIENRALAIDGEDEELVKKIRATKGRERSKRAIEIMDGHSPHKDESDDGTRRSD